MMASKDPRKGNHASNNGEQLHQPLGPPAPAVALLREGTQDKFWCVLCKCRGYGSFYGCTTSRVHDFHTHESRYLRDMPGDLDELFFTWKARFWLRGENKDTQSG
jgi:hypothetical protein